MKRGNAAGFTLVEVLVAIGIFAVLSTAIVSSLTTTSRSFTDRRVESEAQQDRRTASYILTRNLREVGLDPHGSANAGIEQALADRITFSMDNNLNGTLDAGEQMTFIFDAANGTLTRLPGDGTVGPGGVVASSLSAVTFRYLAADGTDLGVPDKDAALLADIRSIAVDLTTEATRVGGVENFKRSMNLRIACKNL